jgi:hypothetical protein
MLDLSLTREQEELRERVLAVVSKNLESNR